MANTELRVKTRSEIVAQANTADLPADVDPNNTAPLNTTPIDNSYGVGGENGMGAEILNLFIDVTTAPTTSTAAAVWYRTSENGGTNYTRWQYSHTIPNTILTSVTGRYEAGAFDLSIKGKQVELAVVPDTHAFRANLLAYPKLPEGVTV